MELGEEQTAAICSVKKISNSHPSGFHLTNGKKYQLTNTFEIRLFYLRISPCIIDAAPNQLSLSHLRRRSEAALEINGLLIPQEETSTVVLRRDRIDIGSSEVTYVSTDRMRVAGAVDFEVFDADSLIMCGSLEMLDPKTGWSMGCSAAGSNVFYQPKLGISSPSIEVYVAGCCSGFPLILTKTIQSNPRGKPALDAIPEDEEFDLNRGSRIFLHHRPVEVPDGYGYEPDGKHRHDFYSENTYPDDNGELSWFNAGVRVGVGIGLGVCLGIGIGVGLLMRSYQATTRTFRRRFL